MINDCKLPVLLKIEQGSLSWISNTTRHTKLTEIKRIKMIEEKDHYALRLQLTQEQDTVTFWTEKKHVFMAWRGFLKSYLPHNCEWKRIFSCQMFKSAHPCKYSSEPTAWKMDAWIFISSALLFNVEEFTMAILPGIYHISMYRLHFSLKNPCLEFRNFVFV